MARPHHIADALRTHGLAYPGVHEDHPWGETVLKVKNKVFVFLGREDEATLRFSVKLPASGSRWLDQPCAEPTGYGLGKSGWVTFSFEGRDVLGKSELFALLEESYRAVAPKTMVKELDGAPALARKPAAPTARARAPRRKA